ncbi:MAG: tetratricopeptide repeat protein [Candidatus Anstonellales archaeon]
MSPAKPSPTDARTHYQKGNLLYEKGEYEKAIECYNMAIILNPAFSEAYFNRGLCYYNLKNFDKAIQDYTKAAELDPKNAVIYNNRGDSYYRKQDFEKAILDYDKAISLNGRYLKAYYNRGLAYACLEDYEKAVEDFSMVIELNHTFAEAYHLRGLAYDYLNELDKAIADYDKAIELNPNFTEAINHRELAKSKKEGGGAGQSGTPQQGSINPIKLLQKPNMKFSDVAGMEKLKTEINEAIVYPLLKPDLARKYGKFGGGGMMLYGPPGCGKTFIVKAAAGECNSAFINAKISDVLDMYVGNTEKNIHAIFETARKNTPSIVFFDELEALGGRREDMTQATSYMKMAVNQLLYEMDGIESNNVNVLILGATNAPWDVDPALRRSGRFGKTIFVPEPDFASRKAILRMHAKKRPVSKFIAYNRIALATWGYSSSDLKALVEDAAAIPWREAFKTGKQRNITTSDFITALKKRRSTLPPWYEQAKKQIGRQEERTIIDGKEHLKITESKMGVGEKEAFRDLLKVIEWKNKWYVKAAEWLIRKIALYLPIPF